MRVTGPQQQELWFGFPEFYWISHCSSKVEGSWQIRLQTYCKWMRGLMNDMDLRSFELGHIGLYILCSILKVIIESRHGIIQLTRYRRIEKKSRMSRCFTGFTNSEPFLNIWFLWFSPHSVGYHPCRWAIPSTDVTISYQAGYDKGSFGSSPAMICVYIVAVQDESLKFRQVRKEWRCLITPFQQSRGARE